MEEAELTPAEVSPIPEAPETYHLGSCQITYDPINHKLTKVCDWQALERLLEATKPNIHVVEVLAAESETVPAE